MGVLSHTRFRVRDESWILPHSYSCSVSAPSPVQTISKIGSRLTSVSSQAKEAVCTKGHLD